MIGLVVSQFHDLDEIERNAARICASTHADKGKKIYEEFSQIKMFNLNYMYIRVSDPGLLHLAGSGYKKKNHDNLHKINQNYKTIIFFKKKKYLLFSTYE